MKIKKMVGKFTSCFNLKKDVSEKGRYAVGYASTSDKDRTEEVITREALDGSKGDLLKPGSSTVFFNHNRNIPIGKVVKTWVDENGLGVRVKISEAKDVNDIWVKIQEGVLNSFSISGIFKKIAYERDEEGRISLVKILKMELYEVSVVGIPANPKATIFQTVEKSLAPNIRRKTVENSKVTEESEKSVEKKVEEQKSLTKDDVMKLIEENNKKLVEDLTKALTPKTETVSVKEKKEEKKEKIPGWAKKILKMQKRLSHVGSRKGIVNGVSEGDREEGQDTPEKALIGRDDPKSVAFVRFVMDNPSHYDALSKEEKQMANSIYYSLIQEATRKDKKD